MTKSEKLWYSGQFYRRKCLSIGNAWSTPTLKLESIIWRYYLLTMVYGIRYTSTFSINAYRLTDPKSIHPKAWNLRFNNVDDSLLCLQMANSSSKKTFFFLFRFLCHFMQKHSMFDIRPSEHRLIYVNGITNKRKNHSNFKMVSLLFVLFRNCENGNGFAFNSLLLWAQTLFAFLVQQYSRAWRYQFDMKQPIRWISYIFIFIVIP